MSSHKFLTISLFRSSKDPWDDYISDVNGREAKSQVFLVKLYSPIQFPCLFNYLINIDSSMPTNKGFWGFGFLGFWGANKL